MDLKRGDDGKPYLVETFRLEDGGVLTLQAKDVRRTNTGPHGWVGMAVDGIRLADHTFNLTRIDERAKLTNSALGRLNGRRASYKGIIAGHLDDFCGGVPAAWIRQVIVEKMEGDLTIRAATFVLRPYAIEGAGTVLFAPPGSGKSYTGKALALHIDAGDEIPQEKRIWHGVIKRRMLYVNLERSRESMAARLARMNIALGLPSNRPMFFMNARGRSLSDIVDSLFRDIHELKIKGIVVDSISRSGVGSLKEDEAANRFIDMVNSLGVFWIALGHTSRDDADHLFGSQMFDAGADIMAKLVSHQEAGADLGVALRVTKGNDIGRFPPEYLGFGFNGDDGLELVYRARESDFSGLAAVKALTLGEKVKAYMKEHGSGSATQIATQSKLNRANVASELAKSKDYAVIKRGKNNEKFYGLAYFP